MNASDAPLKIQRACVTGGAGFIGSHLVGQLVRAGVDTVVLDDLSTGREENLTAFESEITFHRGTILSTNDIDKACAGCDVIFHLAAYVSAPGSVQEPAKCREINETGTFNVLEAARRAGVRRVVFTSSSAVYGDGQALPKQEAHVAEPTSPYGLSKAVGELMMSTWSACYGLETASLRLFNVYGPGQQADSAYAAVIAAFMAAVTEERNPIVYGDGTQTRDFIFVEDVAQAFLLAGLRAEPMHGDVFNIGRGEGVSVLELAEGVISAAGRNDVSPEYQPPRAGDIMHSCADITRARQTLGFEPRVSLEEGLAQTLAWYEPSRAPAKPQ